MSDPLNSRRELLADLERATSPGSPERILAVFKLDGLADLAERFGPALRDKVTVRANRRLLLEVAGRGRCYVSRRNELCALLDVPLEEAIAIVDAAARGINEIGRDHVIRDHVITAEPGIAILPTEADSAIAALRRADGRTIPGSVADEQDRRGRNVADTAERFSPQLHRRAG